MSNLIIHTCTIERLKWQIVRDNYNKINWSEKDNIKMREISFQNGNVLIFIMRIGNLQIYYDCHNEDGETNPIQNLEEWIKFVSIIRNEVFSITDLDILNDLNITQLEYGDNENILNRSIPSNSPISKKNSVFNKVFYLNFINILNKN